MRNKKGALELSINAIVIVILAMTLLGLGLGFVRGMFGKITGISDDTFVLFDVFGVYLGHYQGGIRVHAKG